GHIHFKITASDHKELVTQLYFQGDPFIDDDPWASDKDAEDRIIVLDEDNNGNKSGTFDIKMMPD
ncbi:MAG: catechol 1,2-dioxygenase, partial [Bacteroidetes bacterium]|nr:catechol 1,2-dioxygenase [Bacteroidota bacterium]